MSKNSRQIFLIFLAYYGMTCVSNAYFLFGPYYESLGATPQRAGLFLSAFYMVTLFCRPLGSIVMERLDIRRTLIGSALLCAAATAGIALTLGGGASLLVFRALSGIFFSVFIVATVAAQSILLDEKSRGIGFALFTTGSMLPLATVVPLCEWFINGGFGALYIWTPVVISLLCAAVGWKVSNLNYTGKDKSEFPDEGLRRAAAHRDNDVARRRGHPFRRVSGRSARRLRLVLHDSERGRRRRDTHARLRPHIESAARQARRARRRAYGLRALRSRLLLVGVDVRVFRRGVRPRHRRGVPDELLSRRRPHAAAVLLVIDVGWIVSPLMYGYISPVLGASNTYRFTGLLVFAAAAAIYWKYWRTFTPRAASRR